MLVNKHFQKYNRYKYHCKVKEILFIQELQPALNANVSSEKLLLPFTDSFRLKRLKFLLQMFSV